MRPHPARLLFHPLLAYFCGGMVVANLVCLAVAAVKPAGEKREALCRKIVGSLTRGFLRLCALTGVFKVENRAAGKLAGLRGAVVVANHRSLIDAPVLFSTDPELVCFYKSALKKKLLGLPCAQLSGFIANDSGIAGLFAAAKHLERGRNVLIFPESTRTATGSRLDAFGRSAALLAVRADAPVVALVFRYEKPFLAKSSRFCIPPMLPIRLVIEHAATLRPADFADANALNSATRDIILKALSSC